MTASSTWKRVRLLTMGAALALMALALLGLRGELANAEAAAQASKAKGVNIANFAFHPPNLTIAAGSKVRFTNSSKVTHTATRGGAFNTGEIKPGKSAAIRFEQPGTFVYHCLIHPEMHGKIVVQ